VVVRPSKAPDRARVSRLRPPGPGGLPRAAVDLLPRCLRINIESPPGSLAAGRPSDGPGRLPDPTDYCDSQRKKRVAAAPITTAKPSSTRQGSHTAPMPAPRTRTTAMPSFVMAAPVLVDQRGLILHAVEFHSACWACVHGRNPAGVLAGLAVAGAGVGCAATASTTGTPPSRWRAGRPPPPRAGAQRAGAGGRGAQVARTVNGAVTTRPSARRNCAHSR
jgi:hypothetical protein